MSHINFCFKCYVCLADSNNVHTQVCKFYLPNYSVTGSVVAVMKIYILDKLVLPAGVVINYNFLCIQNIIIGEAISQSQNSELSCLLRVLALSFLCINLGLLLLVLSALCISLGLVLSALYICSQCVGGRTLNKHMATCPFTQLPCSKKCVDKEENISQFMKKDLDEHLENRSLLLIMLYRLT